MNALPSGTVTFLFTDIEGSTQLWENHPEAMKTALARHDSILREAIESNHGHIIKTTGDGFHAVFETAIDAVHATLAAQRAFQASELFENSEASSLRVRMGLHTGEAELRDGDYYGQSLNRAARVMSVGYGGQILLSSVTADLAREHLTGGESLIDLGEHHLKGLLRPEHIYQLTSPGLEQNFPALQSLSAKTNNLPPQLTSFIGRERELAEAKKRLGNSRLVTLIGPGGTGKTRLSLQVGVEQLHHFKDGVWFVELAPISSPALVISAIASVFDLREVQGVPFSNVLLDYLRAKELLLILDNCEHLVEASAQAADQILHACAQVKVIASSREALGIDGESVFRVPSLPDTDATRLFAERAAKVDSRFRVTEQNASSIAQICTRLDGIPLAIELAAARVKLFTPEQIAQRLDDRFKLLTGGSRTALPRQQTLRALIDWSYLSLNEMEQRALRRLAVFSGGWTFEAAESAVGESEAMDGLLGLVNKSLVNVEEQEGASRYRFLETIRQYAMEKLLESGEAVEARNCHLEFVLQIAEKSDQRMFGAESGEWLDQMELEHDNLRAALEWAASNDILKAMRLALGLGGFWTSRDYNSEARYWCRTILERSESLADADEHRAKLYAMWGWTAVTTGNHKESRAAAEAGLPLARKADEKRTIVHLLIILGLSSLFIGDMDVALQATEEALLLARQFGFKGELAMALTSQAQVNYFGTRDPALSKKNLDEATALGNEAGFQWITSMSAYGAGRLAGHLGDIDTARAKFMESAEISKRFGNRRMVYSSRSEFAHVLREHGVFDEAYEIYKEVIPGWKDLGHRAAIAHELECIAYILIKREEPERAASLLGAAEALRQIIDTHMTQLEREEYEREVAALRAGMEERDFHATWEKGRAMTMDEAIELAVKTMEEI
jgi:predicted ATPase/class 3 adenylate cyclase